MAFLYHGVPDHQYGEVLYPLNQLREVFPQAYEEEVKKYHGREFILQQKLPKLRCLWNDVLHFTAVHPAEVKAALIEAGSDDFTRKYYEIDPSLLEPEEAIIYLYKYEDTDAEIHAKNVAVFHPNELERYTGLPAATKRYYAEEFLRGHRPLLYHLVPHILYKGTLRTTDLPIVTV